MTNKTTNTTDWLLDISKGQRIQSTTVLQPLWSDCGTLSRIKFDNTSTIPSLILKHIHLPETLNHPLQIHTEVSKTRKIHSYQVEATWYENFNHRCAQIGLRTPVCLDLLTIGQDTWIALEDLQFDNFHPVSTLSLSMIHTTLRWLATFHATFLNDTGNGLWAIGTYWNLSTRPDEFMMIQNTEMHDWARFIDARLNQCTVQTLVHGDAKLANFLYSTDGAVAGLDFQYVGRGCGVKDVVYFLGSCLPEDTLNEQSASFFNIYFAELRKQVSLHHPTVDCDALEQEWRTLTPFAIADFERFLLGWSPNHRKRTGETQDATKKVLSTIQQKLLQDACNAAKEAGQYILSQWKEPIQERSKGYGSRAVDIVTEVDEQAQSIILNRLKESMQQYDIGLLAEEGIQDDSRLSKHAFWTIDPLDGTLFFANGTEGFAVSIALVNQAGDTLIAVVYDPVKDTLWHSIKGQSVYCNGQLHPPSSLASSNLRENQDSPLLVLDPGFKEHPWFSTLEQAFDIRFPGGAVQNVLTVLQHPRSWYMKVPKKRLGGCAIWDLAAISLLCTQSKGSVQDFNGERLSMNRPDKLYFNDVGFVFTGSAIQYQDVMEHLQRLGLSVD